MQIHELNTFSGSPTGKDFIAIDNGSDTQKISAKALLQSLDDDLNVLKANGNYKVNIPVDNNNQPSYGNNGQILRTRGNGVTEWVDVGLPTDEQTEQAINEWLNAHPEATTTVQDNSITEEKLSASLKEKVIKTYLTPQMFGAVADGITDDTIAIQNCLDAVEDGGVICFPKVGGSYTPHYKITATLTLSKNDVTIFSEPSAEYSEGIFSDNGITLLKVSGFGCSLHNLVFKGNGSDSVKSTTNGIVFDRSSLGNAETFSNIDCKISDCIFFQLNDCITVVGKNANIYNNLFSNSLRGVVVVQHTYTSGSSVIGSELHGIRIVENRFHSIGQFYFRTRADIGTGNYPLDISSIDSWCIEIPLVYKTVAPHGIEIRSNHADVCFSGFFKGSLVGTIIQSNAYIFGAALFCYCPYNADTLSFSRESQSIIDGNVIYGYQSTTRPDRGYSAMFANFIVVSGNDNLVISNNTFKTCGEVGFDIQNCARLDIINNFVNNVNRFFVEDTTQRNGFNIISCSKCLISGNFFDSQYGIASEYGFYFSGGSNISYLNNLIFGGVTNETNQDLFYSSLYQSPLTASDWIEPEFMGTFAAATQSEFGYRKTADGMVEFCLGISGGKDNGIAFILPNNFRPSKPIMEMVRSTAQHDINVVIDVAGNVTINDLQQASGETINGQYWLNFKFPLR